MGRWVRSDDELDELSVGRRRRHDEWVLLVSLGRHKLALSSVDRVRLLGFGYEYSSGSLGSHSYVNLCWHLV